MKLLWNALYGNGWYKQKNVWAIKTIIGNDGILLLNEKHMKQGLDQKKFARDYNKIWLKS